MRKWTMFLFVIALIFAAACSHQNLTGEPEPMQTPDPPMLPFENAQSYEGKGFSFYYPEDWLILSELQVQDSVTLRLQEKKNTAAQIIISYLPAQRATEEEALRDAETLLRGSLFNIKDELTTQKETVGSREIPIIYTRSGETEFKMVRTAVMTGEKGYLLITLIAREEGEEYFAPVFHSLLEGIKIDL